jgi:diguanylate cyclase (GGDEF)-like protein
LPYPNEAGAFVALRDCSILVVDDDPIAIKLVCQILSTHSNVRFATSGPDALRLVRASPPELILLDGEMPGQNGFEVCKILKADPAYAHIPIIFVTAHDDEAFETLALTLGAADFISKPFSAAKMKLRVTLHLQLQRQMEALRSLANTDTATSLANRRKFDEVLASEWHRARRTATPLSLLMIDIDFFKAFNDEYGHPAGDECLRSVAHAIRAAALRPTDLAARFGGEEFAVILPHTDAIGALVVARRIRDRLSAAAIPHRGSRIAPRVTVSVGVACQCSADSDASERDFALMLVPRGERQLVDAADRALYHAKRSGRDRAELAPPEDQR